MSVKDNRGKCDFCGLPTTEQDRVKVVYQKKSGEEACHIEAHRGHCFAQICKLMHYTESGEVEDL